MSLMVANKQLNEAHRELRRKWVEASEVWDDGARQQFERDVIEPLEKQVRLAAGAMEQMHELLTRARRSSMGGR